MFSLVRCLLLRQHPAGGGPSAGWGRSLVTSKGPGVSLNTNRRGILTNLLRVNKELVPLGNSRRGLMSRLFKRNTNKPRFRLGLVVGGGGVLLFMYSIRAYRDSLVLNSRPGQVHKDRSEVRIAAHQQVTPTVKIVTGPESQAPFVVDQQKYTKFVQDSIAKLIAAQKEMEVASSELLSSQLSGCFDGIHPRAEHFADWYFSYSTSFKLLQEATLSLARNTINIFDPRALNEAVAEDMDKYLTSKYERIVLRPEINNSNLTAAYLKCVKDIHAKYTEVIASIEKGMLDLIANETNHLNQPQAEDVSLSLDWNSQLHKIKTIPANFEKNPEMTILLSSAGAVVVKTLASKGASIASAKVLAGKLGAPFVSKAMAAGGGAALGAVTGPLGSLIGATLGLGIDYSVNLGVELVKREEFVKDVGEVLRATQRDYQQILEQELHRAASVWITDAIQLLPHLGPDGHHLPSLHSAKQGAQ